MRSYFRDPSTMQSSPLLSLSPSFNSYSSTRLAEVAARVVEEFRAESTDPADYGGGGAASYNYPSNPFHIDYSCVSENRNNFRGEVIDDGNKGNDEHDDNDDDFEFAVVSRDFISSPAAADVLFCNGQIRPCFPLFNQDLLLEAVEFGKQDLNSSNQKSPDGLPPPPVTSPRLSLRELFLQGREPSSSCSSSEADDLDGINPESYCVWTPKMAAVEGRCKKSSSTGWSRRWRIRDLLHRSQSDGKDNIVFSSHPSKRSENASKKSEEKVKRIEKSSAVAPEALKA